MVASGDKLGTFMKVEPRGLAGDARKFAMNAQDIPARADEGGLDLREALDGCMAPDGIDPPRIAARSDDARHQRRDGNERIVDARFCCGDLLLEPRYGEIDTLGHDFSSAGSACSG